MKRLTRIFILILLIAGTLPIQARAAEESAPAFNAKDIVPGELIVIMNAGKSAGKLTMPEKARRPAKIRKGLGKLRAEVILVPVGEESAYILKIKKLKDVQSVEPNYRVSAQQLTPDDTSYGLQYAPALIQAESAWDITTGSGSVILAIIDSGLDADHPEFAGRIVPGYDFIQDDTTPQDECGHGTHVAGIAAASGNNGMGIAGIAWGVKIMPLRILGKDCSGSFADMADALVFAADHGANVINISVGAGVGSTLLENATYYAYSRGAAIFAAAGNQGTSPFFYHVLYPAAYSWVMAVGSVDSSSARVPSSNYDSALDLMAPGDSIYSTLPLKEGFFYNTSTSPVGIEYDYLSGTSMASPQAAGAAALLASLPCITSPDEIYEALTSTAQDLGTAGRDDYNGYGLIQIRAALDACPIIAPPILTLSDIQYDLLSSQTCSPAAQYLWRDTSGLPSNIGDRKLFTLPFTFDFAGTPYTNINVHDNGFISMGNNNNSATDGNYKSNFILPGAALPNNFLAAFWDDLHLSGAAGTGVYTATLDSAPNRKFVIEYRDTHRMRLTLDPYDPSTATEPIPGSDLTFEVVLFETSNEILFQYKTLNGTGADGSSATVGLEYGNITSGLGATQHSYNEAGALKNGLALLFIPYTSIDPLPSSICPQMTRAKTMQAGEVNTCDISAADTTFDVNIDAGQLAYRSTLKIQQPVSAPVAMSAPYLDLKHYADIQLRYAPPAVSLDPMPLVTVCYQYTAADVLKAGGHPENLFIAAHYAVTGEWEPLTTTVDALNSRLTATAPHFSYYGVGTFRPSGSTSGELGLPVTGAALSREFGMLLGAIFLAAIGLWARRNRK